MVGTEGGKKREEIGGDLPLSGVDTGEEEAETDEFGVENEDRANKEAGIGVVGTGTMGVGSEAGETGRVVETGVGVEET